jgi:hypothetical protein
MEINNNNNNKLLIFLVFFFFCEMTDPSFVIQLQFYFLLKTVANNEQAG